MTRACSKQPENRRVSLSGGGGTTGRGNGLYQNVAAESEGAPLLCVGILYAGAGASGEPGITNLPVNAGKTDLQAVNLRVQGIGIELFRLHSGQAPARLAHRLEGVLV